MADKVAWSSLPAKKRMELLVTKLPTELAASYFREGLSDEQFRAELETEIKLWNTANISEVGEINEVPTKDVVLGAWRDLDRGEALLELIDNSIDAWHARREEAPKKSAKVLNITIRIDKENGRLEYEDNAGGVPTNKLPNLVVPGFSDTEDLSQTIGSYKTGGKKAIFRLAYAARILTRFWDPKEEEDVGISVQLDQAWIEDSQRYAFSYARLKNTKEISKGSTRYVLQLRKEDIDPEPWYANPAMLGKVTRQIANTYTLLMIREPNIKMSFGDKPITPNESLYDFSATKTEDADIRPQQVVFKSALEYKGQTHAIEIELVLGCRVTTGVKEGKTGGIDLYGNNRLFASHDLELFEDLLPKGNSRNLARGFINIRGPNIFIPWDTHKRHLNADRDIVRRLKTTKLIREVFENWKRAYRAISRLGTGEVTDFIETPLKPVVDKRKKDFAIPHRSVIDLDFSAVRGVSLPQSVYVPAVPERDSEEITHKLTLILSPDQTRAIMAYYKQSGEPTQEALRELADLIKEEVMEWVEGARHE